MKRAGSRAKTPSWLQRARRQAAALGPARSYLNCLIGVLPQSRPCWEKVLRMSRAAGAQGGGPEAWRLEGRAWAFLAQPAKALSALDRAVAADPLHREGLAWRGEAHLLGGSPAAARADLDAAVSRDPRWPWARLLRAVCLLSCGDLGAAEADLKRAAACAPAAAAAAGVYALLEGQRGSPRRGLSRLDRALDAGSSAFLWAVRGLLRRDLGDLAGSLEAFNRAVGLEPSAWLYSQRADVLNRTGFFNEAVEDARRAGRLLPDSPQPHAQAADIYFDQARYEEAMAEIGLALAKSPDDVALLSRRARFHLVLGRLDEAGRDLERAQGLDAGNRQLVFERMLVSILLGREAQVLAELGAAGLAPALEDYLKGYIACRRRDYQKASAYLKRSAAAADGGLAQRAGFYALVAKILGRARGLPRGRGAQPRFYLCGIGINHPYQISVEALQALGRCGVLYNNLGDPQVTEFLGLFGARIKAVTRVGGEPASGRVERLIAGLRPGRPAGFVTRIHPYIYRRIANDLVTALRREGISFQAFGAVSLTEVSCGLGDAAAADCVEPLGVRVFDIYYLIRRPDLLEPRAATVVYCIAGATTRRQLCRLLAGRYPAEHAAFILAGSGDKEKEVEAASVGGLEGRLLAVDPGAVLYVPAFSGGTPWKK